VTIGLPPGLRSHSTLAIVTLRLRLPVTAGTQESAATARQKRQATRIVRRARLQTGTFGNAR
jgi:hypothetical protein